LIVFVLLSGSAVVPAQAAFSSLYIFGDGTCTTTGTPAPAAYYYGNRYCNGRVWVEVLAQRQGVTYTASKNLSYFYHLSSDLVTEINGFSATDASTSLFVIWVNDADFVYDMDNIFLVYGLDLARWNNAISSSLANHQTAIQNLYTKGARTVIAPNAVDITKIPQYSGLTASEKSFIRGRVVYFNTSYVTMLNQVKATRPGLTIYVPDFFSLLDDMKAHPANYGLSNTSSDALDDGYTALNGPGASYLFWDLLDPTAKAHEVMADTVHRMISPPVKINKVTWLGNGNRLEVTNIPFGLTGYVEGRTDLVSANWTSVTNFNITNATQTIFVPASGPRQFYRLYFPFSWSWP
jgi:phospholipase/lecithinase/hemolysin